MNDKKLLERLKDAKDAYCALASCLEAGDVPERILEDVKEKEKQYKFEMLHLIDEVCKEI